jgi:hypothetical protein
MATGQLTRVIHQLHKVCLRQDAGGMTDANLMESFLRSGDEEAFEALVRRHGPMV